MQKGGSCALGVVAGGFFFGGLAKKFQLFCKIIEKIICRFKKMFVTLHRKTKTNHLKHYYNEHHYHPPLDD